MSNDERGSKALLGNPIYILLTWGCSHGALCHFGSSDGESAFLIDHPEPRYFGMINELNKSI